MNPMDKHMQDVNVNQYNNLYQQFNAAMSNPAAFQEQFKKLNPDAYNKAMQLANVKSPKQAVMQILQSRGINPAMFNMLGLK